MPAWLPILARDALASASLAEAGDLTLLIDRVPPAPDADPAVILLDFGGRPDFLCDQGSRVLCAAACRRAAILTITDPVRGCRVSFVRKLSLARPADSATQARPTAHLLPRLVSLPPSAIFVDTPDSAALSVPIGDYFRHL